MCILEAEARQEKKTRQIFVSRIECIKRDLKLTKAKTTTEVLDAIYRRASNKNDFKQSYDLICKELNRKYVNEIHRTPAEVRFADRMAKQTKLQFYPQTWIGNMNIDSFVPALGSPKPNQLRGYKLRGLGIEIDGSIHEREAKMKKDAFKMECLNDLGISLWRFTDEQVFSGRGILSATQIKREFRTLCSRARDRIWGRIHLLTILYHGDLGMVRFPQRLRKNASLEGVMS